MTQYGPPIEAVTTPPTFKHSAESDGVLTEAQRFVGNLLELADHAERNGYDLSPGDLRDVVAAHRIPPKGSAS